MKLLIVRHAIAEDRDAFRSRTGEADSLRPLIPKGVSRMKKAARGLARITGAVDLLACSPYVRATQTAALLRQQAGFPEAKEAVVLTPDRDPDECLVWLAGERASLRPDGPEDREPVFAVVGHEPHLSRLIAWALTGRTEPLGELGKGGACLLDFDGPPAAGSARLFWLVRPATLRELA